MNELDYYQRLIKIENHLKETQLIPKCIYLLYATKDFSKDADFCINELSLSAKVTKQRVTQLNIDYKDLNVFHIQTTNESHRFPRVNELEVQIYHPGEGKEDWEANINEIYSSKFPITQETAIEFDKRFCSISDLFN